MCGLIQVFIINISMTPDIFNTAKNLFIIFPPGCGGNHLANMLSMNPLFSQRFTGIAYQNRMLHRYRSKFKNTSSRVDIAHFGYLENLHILEISANTHIIENNTTINLWCAHYDEYFNNQSKLTMYTNRIIGMMSYPTLHTIPHHRMTSGLWYNGVVATHNELYEYSSDGMLYPKPRVKRIMYISDIASPNHIFNINTDIFFTHAGYNYLNNILISQLGCRLPAVCDEMHELWVESMIRNYKG